MATCRKWRDIIHGTPTLWREIIVRRRLEWLAVCLPRSQQLLVNVSFHSSGTNLADARHILRPHNDRVASLTFYSLHCAQLDRCMPLQEMHNLKSMHVKVHHGHGADATKHRGVCPILVLNFPRLEELSVEGLTVCGHPPAFSTLRYLTVGGCIGPRKTMRLAEFVGCLKSCVLLEKLDLQIHALDAVLFDIPQGTGPIATFPRLRDLSIRGKVEEVSNLLSHMEIRDDVDICLETDDQVDTHRAAVAARAMLPSDVTRSRLGILKSATRIMVDVPRGKFYDAVTITATQGMNMDHKINIVVRVLYEERSSTIDDGFAHRDAQATYFLNALAQLPSMFPSAPVETLVCRGDVAAVDEGTWWSLCAKFPTLRSLVVEDTICFANVTPLFRALGSPQSHGQARPLCRYLEYIWIRDANAALEDLEELRKCIKWRIDQRAPLRRLRLELHAIYEGGAPPDVSGYRAEFARLVPHSSLITWDIYDAAHNELRSLGVTGEFPFWRSD
ncbi:hypothetical protein C8T65DRAFT_691612 [Cerioporus squamosus]|nr:hypothetical protein C8T65DRAFT_691612 [Cerioporus squamosus]